MANKVKDNKREFFKYIRNKQIPYISTAPLLDNDNKIMSQDAEKAEK